MQRATVGSKAGRSQVEGVVRGGGVDWQVEGVGGDDVDEYCRKLWNTTGVEWGLFSLLSTPRLEIDTGLGLLFIDRRRVDMPWLTCDWCCYGFSAMESAGHRWVFMFEPGDDWQPAPGPTNWQRDFNFRNKMLIESWLWNHKFLVKMVEIIK